MREEPLRGLWKWRWRRGSQSGVPHFTTIGALRLAPLPPLTFSFDHVPPMTRSGGFAHLDSWWQRSSRWQRWQYGERWCHEARVALTAINPSTTSHEVSQLIVTGVLSMIFETTALVNVSPAPRSTLRDWVWSVATTGIFVAAPQLLPHPIRFWSLLLVGTLLTLAAHYDQYLGRITVASDLIRVQRRGSVTEYPRNRIVIISARGGGVHVALNDGRWVLFSWSRFLPKRERRARADGLLQALGGVTEDDVV